MVLRVAVIAMLLGQTLANLYIPPRGVDVARRHGGNWSQKSGNAGQVDADNPHTQGGPLLGNADLSAVLQVDRSGSVFSYYVTKTDAWSTNDIFGLGLVTLEIPALNGSSQSFIRQDLGSATTIISANTSAPVDSTGSGDIQVSMSSFIAATTNIMSTTISITTPSATQLMVANAVYSGVTYEVDPKTRMPTGAPARTLANCTDFGRNGVRNRGPHRAGFAAADATSMWALYIQCTNGSSEASRLGLATRILTPPAANVSVPECGPVALHSGL
eukprot:COSAG02_NODE_13393_length_1400_cov_1.765565_1_plen_272_part_10